MKCVAYVQNTKQTANNDEERCRQIPNPNLPETRKPEEQDSPIGQKRINHKIIDGANAHAGQEINRTYSSDAEAQQNTHNHFLSPVFFLAGE